jgi:hypothetical protein
MNDQPMTIGFGLTRRQWLAGMAMQGMIASGYEPVDLIGMAGNCYEMADAMLAFEEQEAKK